MEKKEMYQLMNENPAMHLTTMDGNHPTRKFLQAWKEQGIDGMLQVFRMRHGSAVTWTMESNFDKKNPVSLD